jgi:hypothetical protein
VQRQDSMTLTPAIVMEQIVEWNFSLITWTGQREAGHMFLLHRLALHIDKIKAHFSYHSPFRTIMIPRVITKSCVVSLT